MTATQVLIDGNALGYTCHHNDKIVTVDGMETQAVSGFLEAIRDVRLEFPLGINLIVLWDGVSWRKSVIDTYKDNRDAHLEDFDTSKPMDEVTRKRYDSALKKAQSRAAYKKQGPYIERALKHLGIPQATCFNYEADDLAALFADRYVEAGHPVRLLTSDGDWLQLVQNRVVWRSHKPPYRHVSLKNYEHETGYRTPDLFVESKILSGDKGDNVKGVPGFGDVALGNFFKVCPDGIDQFFATSMNDLEINWRSISGKKMPKPVAEFREAGAGNPLIALNRTLVDLRTPDRPAPSSIKIERGAQDPAAFKELCKSLDLSGLALDAEKFFEAFTGEAA